MIRFLFTVSVPNAKLDKMFSKLKCVKTNFRCSLGVKRLENILKTIKEGSSWETFDIISVIKLIKVNKALIKLGTQLRRKDQVATGHIILLK